MTLSDPKRRSGRSTTSDPPLGPRIDNSVEAQGFSDGHGRGHVWRVTLLRNRIKPTRFRS